MKTLGGLIIGILIGLFFFSVSMPSGALYAAAGEFAFDLGSIWKIIVNVPLDNPLASIIISFLVVKGGPIAWFLLHVLKAIRDGTFDDTECAGALWRLVAMFSGFWPNKSKKILAYAPRHWREVILEDKDPTFRLVAVPLSRVIDVQNLLMPGRTVNVPEDSEGGADLRTPAANPD